jgi:hypothetical protein
VFKDDGLLDTLFTVWNEFKIKTKIMYKLRDRNKEKKLFFRLVTTNDNPSEHCIRIIRPS